MSDNLKIKTVTSIGYSAIARVCIFMLSAASSVVLARNLDASDYGVVGFALIITNFLSRFSDLGIDSAMIQKKDLDTRGLNTGFTVKIAFATCIYLVAFTIAPLSSHFLDHPDTSTVI